MGQFRNPPPPPEGWTANGSREDEDTEAAEKIEVHVHLHRDSGPAGARRQKRPAPRPVLTGVLFDWQGHYDQILKNPPKEALERWSRGTRCKSCDAFVPSKAHQCPRCAAPRPARFLPKVSALLGLTAIAIVFAVCVHVLGSSVPEQSAPTPVGRWSDEDFIVVEVSPTPSPFSYATAASNGSAAPR
jgi:hypothetical protein